MSAYLDLKIRHQQEIEAFPMFFAFSSDQFEDGMAKIGVDPCDVNKLFSIGGGGYIRKSDKKAFVDMLNRHKKEMAEARKQGDTLYDMIKYELANHEYCVTYDSTDALAALGLTMEEIKADPMLWSVFKKAKKDYLAECE